MSLMEVMDPTGHTEVNWEEEDSASVAAARKVFDEMTGQGYSAFRTDGGGGKGERMTTFDPAAEVLVLVPQLRGG